MPYPERVIVTEVGMRDRLQIEDRVLDTALKCELADAFVAAGVRHIELTSFVSPTLLPQLADADGLVPRLGGRDAAFSALVPNRRGAIRAAAAGIGKMLVFISASESHNLRNVNRTVQQSVLAAAEVADVAAEANIDLGGVVATAFGCPFEGDVHVENVLSVVNHYVAFGISEIILGDTTGMATPPIVREVCGAIRERHPTLPINLHFHNTRGLGLVNVLMGLELGIDRYQSSIGGLGGCPFAQGATGNICSEDLIYMLNGIGIETGIDLQKLISIAGRMQTIFGRTLPGQVMKAGPRLGRGMDIF